MRALLGLLALLAFVALFPARAFAFHAGQTFSDPPGAGGGGGIFYLGTPKERGWDCSMCHQSAPGRIRLRLSSDPPELFESFQFRPGIRYAVTVAMEIDGGADELGVGSPGNTNALSATFEDDEGMASGLTTGVATDWSVTNGVILTSKGTTSGVRTFVFNWFAPEAAVAKPTTFYLGLVDGNGGAAQDTFTDPLGDDVFMTHVRFTPVDAAPASSGASYEPPNMARRYVVRAPLASAAAPRAFLGATPRSPWAVAAVPFGLVFVWLLVQRRKTRGE